MLKPRISVLGSRVYVANVLPVSDDGILLQDADIEQQTHAVFRGLQRALRAAGADLADLVRINTCYVYSGPEGSATPYWERMTQVRLEYFPNPGPVGTAVRVAGTGAPGATIQLEAEALLPELRSKRKRIMPKDSWEWSIPLPLSQGWRLDEYVWVGGQISADARGWAVHKGNLRAQTEAVLRHIGSVVKDAGASLDDLLHLKVCYLHDGNHAAAEARLSEIMKTVHSICGPSAPAVTAFGVNLLYEGLLLEIDASAVVSGDRHVLPAQKSQNSAASHGGLRRGGFFHVSGHSAPLAGSLDEKVKESTKQVIDATSALGGSRDNIARTTVLVSKNALGGRDATELHSVVESHWLRAPLPATSIVVVEGLPSGADVQVDAFGVLGERARNPNN